MEKFEEWSDLRMEEFEEFKEWRNLFLILNKIYEDDKVIVVLK